MEVARHYYTSEARPRLQLARFGSHSDTSPSRTISGKSQRFRPNLP